MVYSLQILGPIDSPTPYSFEFLDLWFRYSKNFHQILKNLAFVWIMIHERCSVREQAEYLNYPTLD